MVNYDFLKYLREILGKISQKWYFGPKSKLWSKVVILVKNGYFGQIYVLNNFAITHHYSGRFVRISQDHLRQKIMRK